MKKEVAGEVGWGGAGRGGVGGRNMGCDESVEGRPAWHSKGTRRRRLRVAGCHGGAARQQMRPRPGWPTPLGPRLRSGQGQIWGWQAAEQRAHLLALWAGPEGWIV